MGIFKKISQNIRKYNKIKENPIVIKGVRVTLKKMRNAYFKKNKISYWKRLAYSLPLTELIVVFGKEGFWLNEIIVLNLDKNYEKIRKTLFGNSQINKTKFTRINEELIPIIKLKEKKSKISKILRLP